MTQSKKIDARTQVCAVIGNPVEHSLSPAIHNAAFEALDLNYVYTAFKVEDLAAAMSGFRALGNFRGFSVTIPHKVAIMQYLDEVDEVTRNIGSANTVVKEDGILKGTSSDGPGALKALTDYGVEVAGRQALILGSGGAARAIAFTLATSAKPPDITILGVVPDELERLVHELRDKTPACVDGAPFDTRSLKAKVERADIIIHCTPVGMHPKIEETLITRELLRGGQAVFDIVYNPRLTRLLREAESAGCATIPGVEMFVNQAVVQFELWTGQRAPVSVMRKVVEESFGRT
ncbi:MAG: shikimate dehydrogenase [Candidatus Abyssobacteria bacterium SURF_17]|uniref:Shikimate dehydrogenase (NADP(+)) n=1 Tax=Candidatus Abyssobacteria bacterium SURF_17 TaxID=2093361 RepID=A0A419F303_9BACT|nr:MAG: shikimate dehydrogenase [Candidatus Abyssubacteria bacterium SURF_17]